MLTKWDNKYYKLGGIYYKNMLYDNNKELNEKETNRVNIMKESNKINFKVNIANMFYNSTKELKLF